MIRAVLTLFALSATLSCGVFGTDLGDPNITFAVQPGTTAAATTIVPAVEVELRDGHNAPIDSYPSPVVVQLIFGTSGAVLSGTTSRPLVNGRAVFNDLKVDRAGTGYRLSATAGGLAPGNSALFAVTP